MSNSRNSRRGRRGSHAGRHHTCADGPDCPYCAHNFRIAAARQAAKVAEEGGRQPRAARILKAA